MKAFSDRLVGRSLLSIECREPGHGIGVNISNGAGLTVYTELSSNLGDALPSLIEQVSATDKQIVLHLNGGRSVSISIDRERFADVVELFVYHDTEGYIVEN